MSNYALIENESICSDLENIADWLRERKMRISLLKIERDLTSWQRKSKVVFRNLTRL